MKAALEKLKTSLNKAIETWLEKQCESDAFQELDTYISDDLASHMADAAMAVFCGAVDSQKFAGESEES